MTPKKKIILKHSNGEDVDPITRASNVIFKNGKTAQEVLNDTNDNISDVIENSNSSFKVGEGDTADYTENVVDGAYNSMILKGKSAVNLIKDDMSTSNLVENGNGIFKTNEGMDEYTNIIDGEVDELVIKGNSSYNILPDRTCCTDDVEVTDTKAFSFKDGLSDKVILDTGLSDKMVLKGNTLTNIVRDPVGYASVHEVQDNIVPGSSENIRVLRNIFDKKDQTNIIQFTCDSVYGVTEWSNVLGNTHEPATILKTSKIYTVIIDVFENTLSREEAAVKMQIGHGDYFVNINGGTTGRIFGLVNTNGLITSNSNGIFVTIRPGNQEGEKFSFKNFMIIEGDCSDIAANLPYFKGTLSVNMENYNKSRPKLVSGDCDRTKIYGQTLVDVLGSNRIETEKTFNSQSVINRTISIAQRNNMIIKPDTYYMIRFKISDLNLDGLANITLNIGVENTSLAIIDITNNGHIKYINSNGIYQVKIKTVSNFDTANDSFSIKGSKNEWEGAASVSATRTLTISEVSMYEYQEGMENWDLPYMVGEMRGTGLAKIESIVNGGEKEFVDILGETRDELSKVFNTTALAVGDISNRLINIKSPTSSASLSTDKDYIIRFKISNLNLDGASNISLFIGYASEATTIFTKETAIVRVDTNKIYTSKLRTVSDFSNVPTKLYIKGTQGDWEGQTTSTSRTLTISEVSLYEYTPDMDNMELPYMLGTKRIGYYGERKREYTLPSGLELRSLPNGVRDEFDFESGILTKRVGEINLISSLEWHTLFHHTYGYSMILTIPLMKSLTITDKNYLSNELIANNISIVSHNQLDDNDFSSITFGTSTIAHPLNDIILKFVDPSVTDEATFKSYLDDKNIMLQYELETPQYIDYSKDILEDGEYKVGERINGFQDGYNPTTGKYIKRIDKIVLDGITLASSIMIDTDVHSNDKCLRFYVFYPYIRCINDNEINIKTNSNFKCITRKSCFNRDYMYNSYIVVGKNSEGSAITINIPKSYLFEYSVRGFQDYLSRNPLTIYYVLANEVESNMTQEEFNALTNRANPKLHYFKDGSLKCTCLSGQPKGQLRINTPTSNYYDMQLIKPNTQYTVNNFSNMYIDGTKYQTSSVTPNQLTTPNTITSKKIVVNTSTGSIYPMMVEGVHDVNDTRFFGMKSSTVLMNTRGKNLFNKDAVINGKYQNYNIDIQNFVISDVARYAITEYIPIKPNTTYINSGTSGGAYYDINKNVIKTDRIIGNQITFTTPSNARYIVLNSLDSASETPIWGDNPYIMEASESDTTYEPYAKPHEYKAFVKDSNGVLQAVELNRINDTVYDEIDLTTGIVTRHVKKIVLSGNNEIFYLGIASADWTMRENTYPFYTYLITDAKRPGVYITDKLPIIVSRNNMIGSVDYPSFNMSETSETKKNYDTIRLSIYDVEGENRINSPYIFRDYLKENPITILYECEPYTEQAYIMIDGEFKTSLMLPNGTANGYNPITKVQTNRIKSITYDGNYSGNYSIEREYDRDLIELYLDFPSDTNTIISNDNKYFYSHQLPISYAYSVPRIAPYPGGFYLTLPKEKIGYNLDTLKQYLSTNPITIYYDAIETTETLDTFNYDTVVNNFHLSNKYGYKVENNNEIRLSKVVHHLPTANMLFCPLIQPSTRYYITGMGWGMIIDGVEVPPKEAKYLDTPSTIASKKILVNGISFNLANQSLFKYTGYDPNFSRQYLGYMRSDAISNSRNNMITFNGKNLIKLPLSDDDVSKYIYTLSKFTTNSSSYSNGKYSIDATLINTIEDSHNSIYVQLTLDQNYLFKKDKIYNFSFKIKPSSNITTVMPAIVKPNVTHIVRKTIFLDGIEKTITGTLVPDITFKGSDYSSGIKFALDCIVIGIPEDKHVTLEVSDIILTESDNTAYEPHKTPSINEYTIQRALTTTSGAINGSGIDIDRNNTVRTDYIKVIPGLIYYLYNNGTARAFNVITYNNNKTVIKYQENDSTCRVLIPDGVSYIRLTMTTNASDNLVLKADLPLYKINDNVYDEIDAKTNKFTRRVGRLTDLWKCDITTLSNTSFNIPYASIDYANNNITNINGISASGNILSNNFKAVSGLDANIYSIKMQKSNFVFRTDGSLATANEYKEWFKQHPTDILYELATYETFDLSEYTDNVFTIPTLYKEGTIQLDSSSETYPIINYRTKVNNFYEFDCRAGNYRILANLSQIPCSIRVNNSNAESYTGDSVFTLPEGTNSVVFSDPNVKEIILMKDTIKGNIPCYFKGICDVKAPIIKNINEDESYSNETIIDHDIDGNIIHLRSLPNDIYDELDLETGILTQRIGEMTFDGSDDEKWSINNVTNSTIVFYTADIHLNGFKIRGNIIANKFINLKNIDDFHIKNREGYYATHSSYNVFYFIINKDRLDLINNTAIVAFRKWLQNNPLTVQYELATPITRKVNINDYPFAYENGNVLLTSNSDEPSLTPTIEYTVPFNRNGQIAMNSKLVTRQQKQIDTLEAIIIANLVETQYRQSLTAINYNLEE